MIYCYLDLVSSLRKGYIAKTATDYMLEIFTAQKNCLPSVYCVIQKYGRTKLLHFKFSDVIKECLL